MIAGSLAQRLPVPVRFPVWQWMLCLLGIALIGWDGLSLQAQVSREYRLKAVFLFNFAQFTDWPTNAFASTNSPIVIGVLGTDPFSGVLDETVRGETVKGRVLVVERYRRVEDIQACHILFIAQSEADRLPQIIERLKGKPILTVSDIGDAAWEGVMIRMMVENNRIRLRVNLAAVENAKLSISSKLLQLAEVIKGGSSP